MPSTCREVINRVPVPNQIHDYLPTPPEMDAWSLRLFVLGQSHGEAFPIPVRSSEQTPNVPARIAVLVTRL